MARERILVVEDDPAILVGLQEKLRREGYDVDVAEDGVAASERLAGEPPDLVILDLMLPRRSGIDVLRELRAQNRTLPVLILSARGQEEDKVEGLRTGADDYLSKPFGLAELIARIEALLRRARGPEDTVSFGSITIHLDSRRVVKSGEEVELSRKELDVLFYLLHNRDRTVSREEVLRGVWGYSPSSSARSVDFHILNLRKKLEADPSAPTHLVTRHGVGFQLLA